MLGNTFQDEANVDMFNWYTDTLIPKLMSFGTSKKSAI